MEDPFDIIPAPYRAERLGRMRDLIMQIETDCELYYDLKQKFEEGINTESEQQDLRRTVAWLKRNMIAYRRLNTMNIEGITCSRITGFSLNTTLDEAMRSNKKK